MGNGIWLAFQAENYNFSVISISLGRVSCSYYFMAIHNLRCSVQLNKIPRATGNSPYLLYIYILNTGIRTVN